MQITKLTVWSHQGDNKMPSSGSVEFSDGKAYEFGWHPLDKAWFLTGFTNVCGRSMRRGVHSPKRVALLTQRLTA